jgi:glycosyltransferase involved in cell wall biosynthesis
MELVLEAVSRVQARFPDLWLATTGAGLPTEARARLHDPARVLELGHLPDGRYQLFLAAVDLFVFPFADKEMNRGRWPNKIGDYMAAGRPTVSNRTGDLIDLFERHEIGLLAPDDPVQMAECMIRILENAPLAEALGRNARRAAETHYDWRRLTGTLANCLLDAARSHP